jgi:ABC-type transporter Mla subunit MlaD
LKGRKQKRMHWTHVARKAEWVAGKQEQQHQMVMRVNSYIVHALPSYATNQRKEHHKLKKNDMDAHQVGQENCEQLKLMAEALDQMADDLDQMTEEQLNQMAEALDQMANNLDQMTEEQLNQMAEALDQMADNLDQMTDEQLNQMAEALDQMEDNLDQMADDLGQTPQRVTATHQQGMKRRSLDIEDHLKVHTHHLNPE